MQCKGIRHTRIEIIVMLWYKRNACCNSVQNLLSSSLPSKNIKIKIYRTPILPVVLYGCETWLLTLKEEPRRRLLRIGCRGEYFGLRGSR